MDAEGMPPRADAEGMSMVTARIAQTNLARWSADFVRQSARFPISGL